MNKKTLFISLALLAVVLGVAVVVVNMDNAKITYHNDEYSFSIEYPSTGWTVLDCSHSKYAGSPEVGVFIFDETEEPSCEARGGRITLSLYTEAQSHYYEKWNDYEETEVTINGNTYTHVNGYNIMSDTYQNPPDGTSIKIMHTYFPTGDDHILVAAYGQTYHFSNNQPDIPDGTFEQEDYTDVYNDMVQSFRFDER